MNEIGVGLFAVIVGTAVLLLAVLRELAPAGGLTGRGKWFLAAAMGSGILMFAAKLVLIGLFSVMPADTFRQTSVRPEIRPVNETGDVQNASYFASEQYVWQALPFAAPVPTDNPMSMDKVALGKKLFFDKNLSLDRSLACASCHDLYAAAGADGRQTSTGIDGKVGTRNAPTVWNAAFQSRLFWDGRAASLEEQARGPLINPVEMGMPSLDAVVARVRDDPEYPALFQQAYADNSLISMENISAAIASYERTLITPDSPYDRFVRGDLAALNARARRGMALFESVGCVQCHFGSNFSDASASRAGSPYRLFPATDLTLDPALHLSDDKGRAAPGSRTSVWRVPSLRNVALTAPYFHNGAVDKLEDAVRIMAQAQLGLEIVDSGAGTPEAFWSPSEHTMQLSARRTLSEREISDISEFLRALSGDALVAAAKKGGT